MPQATSAQREPSMEEILASIRRIIEDSDSSKKHPSDGEVQQMKAAEAPMAKTEVEAFRAEFRKPPEPPKLEPIAAKPEPIAARPEPITEKKPISLAEVQAEMKRVLPAAPAPAAPTVDAPKPGSLADVQASLVKEPVPQVEPPVAAAERKPVSMADIQALLDKEPAAPEPLVAREPDISPEEAPAKPAIVETVQPAPVAVRQVSVAPVQPFPSVDRAPKPVAPAVEAAPRQSIISAAAGRQVAAAFGELSEAFAATRQKSFDQVAEDMMRPMLQEWMDNNLPILVERLVREEIERVARGV